MRDPIDKIIGKIVLNKHCFVLLEIPLLQCNHLLAIHRLVVVPEPAKDRYEKGKRRLSLTVCGVCNRQQWQTRL